MTLICKRKRAKMLIASMISSHPQSLVAFEVMEQKNKYLDIFLMPAFTKLKPWSFDFFLIISVIDDTNVETRKTKMTHLDKDLACTFLLRRVNHTNIWCEPRSSQGKYISVCDFEVLPHNWPSRKTRESIECNSPRLVKRQEKYNLELNDFINKEDGRNESSNS